MNTEKEIGDMGRDPEFDHHRIVLNGLEHHVVTCGTGAPVLFCHGFPDDWYVWRHQMRAVAAAGYRAIAPDFRGFGETEAAAEPTSYTSADLVSDLVQLLDHFGIARAVIVGHDWGGTAAWAATSVRPDRFAGIAVLSVPYGPRPPRSMPVMMRAAGMDDVYMVYFATPGASDRELEADPESFFRRFFYTLSGDYDGDVIAALRLGENVRLTDSLAEPPGEMAWMSHAEIVRYAERIRARGAASILNAYRGMDRNWDLWGMWASRIPSLPSLYIYGNKEVSLRFPGRANAVSEMMKLLPDALPPVCLAGDVGHWCQLEVPDQVNRALLSFLEKLEWAEVGQQD